MAPEGNEPGFDLGGGFLLSLGPEGPGLGFPFGGPPLGGAPGNGPVSFRPAEDASISSAASAAQQTQSQQQSQPQREGREQTQTEGRNHKPTPHPYTSQNDVLRQTAWSKNIGCTIERLNKNYKFNKKKYIYLKKNNKKKYQIYLKNYLQRETEPGINKIIKYLKKNYIK